jgi:polar amino acid transport system substrate-binding protein
MVKKRFNKMLFILMSVILVMVIVSACGSESTTSSEKTDGDQQETTSSSSQQTSGSSGDASDSSEKKSNSIQGAEDLPPLPSSIKEKGKLVIGVKEDYPPFGFVNQEGKNDGFEIELAKKLAEYAFGDPEAIEFVGVTGSNRIPYLNTGKIDLILATMGVTEERAEEVDYTKEYFKSGVMLLVPKDSDIENIEDLSGKKVIVIKGTTGSIGLEELVPSAEQLKLDKTSGAIRALKAGRGVAFAQDDLLLFDIAEKHPDFKVVGEPFNVTPWAMAVRHGEKEWLEWANAAIEKVEQEDLFYEWFNTWLPNSPLDASNFILRPNK